MVPTGRCPPCSFSSHGIFFLLAAASTTASHALHQAPYSGASFTAAMFDERLPRVDQDAADHNTEVARLRGQIKGNNTGPGSCDLGTMASKEACLQVERGCMFTRLEVNDPSAGTKASNSYCLPCELDGEELPCWSVGAFVGAAQVTECIMSCSHQKRVFQPGYACTDGIGGTQAECFERGTSSGSKCMFVAFEDSKGQNKAQCGPCSLPGSGTWGCPVLGAEGPEDGSKVLSCASQCDEPCVGGPPKCPPTPETTSAGPVAASPGVGQVSSPADVMVSAPSGMAPETTQDPAALAHAAWLAAKKAGVDMDSMPKVYKPYLLYVTPQDVYATTLAPMPESVPLWPNAWAFHGPAAFEGEEAIPEPAMLQQGDHGSPKRQASYTPDGKRRLRFAPGK